MYMQDVRCNDDDVGVEVLLPPTECATAVAEARPNFSSEGSLHNTDFLSSQPATTTITSTLDKILGRAHSRHLSTTAFIRDGCDAYRKQPMIYVSHVELCSRRELHTPLGFHRQMVAIVSA
ncbi:hypothetical protein HBH56_100550 [Parastagonospora nodorum]|uniref:Uncharacterized protein n=2 Tax=Phaeosphaeria nodorum (strain SN15 / ATCC MYA-4574 / FGSC 10173) TaxID=321614 RepID=A0A7U2ICU6_PHANO|nr:hypothetical protein SNOG_20140 [Parastagonospora nodorum SN15]KAH3914230.1 hypothetical protein HBH56_100550 [Parastagonospora nodorum]EDP89826.1 hypothetical protein SNOG_20140 [Parastagonospora nodorum SN15]KAH3930287.1 hypothetical protein HBH54_114870 [Parastagonospora nodorum]KAH4158241.1 hypothetical protein HBH44_118590 [Parastagonospora nodorum]KAH4405787.1 hypothetical protein HBH92_179560 [Parastagonospora nodorum]